MGKVSLLNLTLLSIVACLGTGCGSDTKTASATGGSAGNAASTGGAADGGDTAAGGSAAGGATDGGTGDVTSTGGAADGGAAPGGTSAGTAATGGVTTGGTTTVGCPGTGGPNMVQLPEGYCIDSTEVTQSQYQAWLDTNPSTTAQISECTWNTSFVPPASAMCSGCGSHPQDSVDWCDAYAYCQAVGKRLCGKIGGGANGFSDYANVQLSQWYNACTSHDPTVSKYPYGATYADRACYGAAYATASSSYKPIAVGSLSTCQSTVSGYEGVYDLAGNVAEWEDSCDGTTQSSHCHLRGGSLRMTNGAGTLMVIWGGGLCDYVPTSSFMKARDWADYEIGFRCCS